MAGVKNLKQLLLVSVVWSTFFLLLACVICIFIPERQLRIVNVFSPLITLAMLWAIWMRQRRLATLAQSRLDETAEVFARMSSLSDKLEKELIRRHSSQARPGHDPEDAEGRSPLRPMRLTH